MCLELLGNATVVDDAIRFVSRKSKGNKKLKSSSSYEDDTEESKEPDCDDDDPDKQREERREEETGEITVTMNQIFRT